MQDDSTKLAEMQKQMQAFKVKAKEHIDALTSKAKDLEGTVEKKDAQLKMIKEKTVEKVTALQNEIKVLQEALAAKTKEAIEPTNASTTPVPAGEAEEKLRVALARIEELDAGLEAAASKSKVQAKAAFELQENVDRLQNDCKAHKATISALESKSGSLAEQLNAREADCKRLQDELSAASSDTKAKLAMLTDELTAKSKALVDRSVNLDAAEAMASKFTSQISSLQLELDQAKGVQAKLEALKKVNEEMEGHERALTLEVERVKAQVTAYAGQVAAKESEKVKLASTHNSEIAEKQSHITNLTASVQRFKLEKTKLEEQVKNLEHSLASKEDTIKNLTASVTTEREEVDRLQASLVAKMHEATHSAATVEVEKQKQTIANMRRQAKEVVSGLQAEKAALQARFDAAKLSVEAEIARFADEKAQHARREEDLKKEIESLREAASAKEREAAVADAEMTRLKKEMEDQKARRLQAKNEIVSLAGALEAEQKIVREACSTMQFVLLAKTDECRSCAHIMESQVSDALDAKMLASKQRKGRSAKVVDAPAARPAPAKFRPSGQSLTDLVAAMVVESNALHGSLQATSRKVATLALHSGTAEPADCWSSLCDKLSIVLPARRRYAAVSEDVAEGGAEMTAARESKVEEDLGGTEV